MPTIKSPRPPRQEVDAGVNGLIELVGHRMEIKLVFESRDVVAHLAQMSGGSVREFYCGSWARPSLRRRWTNST